jgi:hypothetical protein
MTSQGSHLSGPLLSLFLFWRWAVHVARMWAIRNAYMILVGIPERKTLLRRLRHRWEGGIKMDINKVWDCGLDSAGSNLAHKGGTFVGQLSDYEVPSEGRIPSRYVTEIVLTILLSLWGIQRAGLYTEVFISAVHGSFAGSVIYSPCVLYCLRSSVLLFRSSPSHGPAVMQNEFLC